MTSSIGLLAQMIAMDPEDRDVGLQFFITLAVIFFFVNGIIFADPPKRWKGGRR